LLPSSALAQASDVSVGDAVTDHDGITLTIPVTVTCDAGSTVDASAGLVERKGNRLIRVFAGTSFPAPTCTGSPQTILLTGENFGPFRLQNGKGTVTIDTFVSGPSGFFFQEFGPFDIRIRKG
jgi:hypothetical protein